MTEPTSSTRIGPSNTEVLEAVYIENKPGFRTTEFWQTTIAQLAGVILMVTGLKARDTELILIGAGLAGISNGAYSLSRGMAKKVS